MDAHDFQDDKQAPIREQLTPNLEKTHKQARQSRVGLAWRLSRGSRTGRARGILRFWVFWEQFTARIWHLQPVPGTTHGLLSIQITRYRGRPVDLPDGTHIGRGDRVAVLHFQNQALMRHASQGPWELLKSLGEDMQSLATWLQTSELPPDIKAVYGLTLLSRAAPRLGFTLRQRPRTLMAWFDRMFMHGLLILYHAEGLQRLSQGTTYGHYPQEAWISRGDLLNRYGT